MLLVRSLTRCLVLVLQFVIASLVMLQPAMIVIDHGHFQYNNVSLGLALLSFALILRKRYVLARFDRHCADVCVVLMDRLVLTLPPVQCGILPVVRLQADGIVPVSSSVLLHGAVALD